MHTGSISRTFALEQIQWFLIQVYTVSLTSSHPSYAATSLMQPDLSFSEGGCIRRGPWYVLHVQTFHSYVATYYGDHSSMFLVYLLYIL